MDFVDKLNGKFEEVYSNFDKIEKKINEQSAVLIAFNETFNDLVKAQNEINNEILERIEELEESNGG